MPKTTVGLEVGSTGVKLVELIHRGEECQLKNLGLSQFPLHREGTDYIREEALVVHLIKGLIQKYKVNKKRVVTSVGGKSVIIRRIRVPQMKLQELDQALKWEAEEYIPYPINEVTFGFHILEKNLSESENGEISLILVGARNEIIQSHLKVIRQAGISPAIIDVNPFALFNVFDHIGSKDKEGTALLEIGHQNTDLVISEKDSPFLVRNIEFGGYQITQGIRDEFNNSYIEAEKLKKSYGLVKGEDEVPRESEESAKVDRIIRKSLDNLVNEIARSFEYYTSNREGALVKKIILSGGGSLLKNIDKFLAEQLGIPVEIINPFKNIIYDSRNFPSELLLSLAPLFSISVGLALREVS